MARLKDRPYLPWFALAGWLLAEMALHNSLIAADGLLVVIVTAIGLRLHRGTSKSWEVVLGSTAAVAGASLAIGVALTLPLILPG